MCTQKLRINETALLNSQTYVNNDGYENINNYTLKYLFMKTSEWSVKKCLLFKVLIAYAVTVQNKKPVQFCTCFIFCTSQWLS